MLRHNTIQPNSRLPRRAGLDALRGAALVSMVLYHACWDLVYIFGVHWPWYASYGAYLWQQSICWTFLLLSGYCFHLGRHRLRRGLTVFCGGAAVSLVTILFMPENRVFFGVLSLLGTASLLTIPLDRLFRRIPARAGLCGSFLLFMLTREISRRVVGFEGVLLRVPGPDGLAPLRLPAVLYQNDFTALFGFPGPGFFSTDYSPLLPWMFLFWTGYFLYRVREAEPPSLPGGGCLDRLAVRCPVLAALGRRSLAVYLAHQAVIYALLWVWFAVLRRI